MTTRNPYKFESAWHACAYYAQDAVAVLYEIMMDESERVKDRINCAKYILDIAKKGDSDTDIGVTLRDNQPLKISIEAITPKKQS